jgi:hypothetical protein
MFERFSDQARRVVLLGQEEARLRGQGEIGTEHMLLGLVDEPECDGAKALELLRISATEVRTHVDEILGRGDVDGSPTGAMPFTPCAKKVLELSSREAMRLGHNDIGTEHILLAMVREREGGAAQVLVSLGVDLSRMRETVVALAAVLGAQRERVRVTASPVDDDATLEDDSVTASHRLLDYDDPAALGVAPTMSGAHVRSAQRVGARKARAPATMHADGTQPAVDDPEAGAESESSPFEAGRSTRPELRPYLESRWERRPS